MAIFGESSGTALPMFREPTADFDDMTLMVDEAGRHIPVEGQPALAIWVRKALDVSSARFVFPAHTGNYGNELHSMLGSGHSVAENRLREMVRGCLLANPYITGVDGFVFTPTGSGLHAAFRVGTVYGDILGESGVDIL
jgi:Protein of unknown function (DUF2634).